MCFVINFDHSDFVNNCLVLISYNSVTNSINKIKNKPSL